MLLLQDFFQLLRPGIDILRPGKPAQGSRAPGLVHFTHDNFREKYNGLEPQQARPAVFCLHAYLTAMVRHSEPQITPAFAPIVCNESGGNPV